MEEYKITSHSDNETIAIAQNIESEKFECEIVKDAEKWFA